MKDDLFMKLIKSIGFNYNNDSNCYEYKDYSIGLYKNDLNEEVYDFFDNYNNSVWIEEIPYNCLSPIQDHFKRELRTYKLKQLLK